MLLAEASILTSVDPAAIYLSGGAVATELGQNREESIPSEFMPLLAGLDARHRQFIFLILWVLGSGCSLLCARQAPERRAPIQSGAQGASGSTTRPDLDS